MSSIALDPGVVEKRPERKGRKERDSRLLRDDAGPDLPGGSKAMTIDDGDNDAARQKRIRTALRWAKAVSNADYDKMLSNHLQGETPKEFYSQAGTYGCPQASA